MLKEFKDFAMRGNVLDMAVGIVIGAAFGKIITSFVSDILMPPIGLGRGCEVRNAILDMNARIGKGVKLINARGVRDEKAESYCIVNGIVVVPKDAAIADGTVI